MLNALNSTGNMALDANGLNDLRRAAKDNSPEAIKATAKQFEAMFMNMMLKSMREATPQDGPFDSEQSRSFTAMLDQQLSQNLANKGMGLADVLVGQLTKTKGQNTDASTEPTSSKKNNVLNATQAALYQSMATLEKATPAADKAVKVLQASGGLASTADGDSMAMASPALAAYGTKPSGPSAARKAFQQSMMTAAQDASLNFAIPTHYLVGQAALESGWGQHEIKGADGSPSFNLFGIKASGDWQGKVVSTMTTEYVNGNKQMRLEKFRAYDSYAASFNDFANLIRSNPRYSNVIGNGQGIKDYALALQQGGYATDPQYASKLARTIQMANAS
jgi:flagellar protein FlgJ